MSIFDKRTNYKPFEYGYLTQPLINAMWAGHWTHNEFNFKDDVQDFKTKLTPEQQEIVIRSVLLTSQIEVAVKSYWTKLGSIFPKPELSALGAVFGGIEVIHENSYSEILSVLGLEDRFTEFLKTPIVRGRVEYLSKYVNKIYKDDRKNIAYSLVLFTLFIEYTALFSQFYILLGFNRFEGGILKDISNIVQYTSKEENLHAEGGLAILQVLRQEHPEIFDEEFTNKIKEEVHEAFLAESKLIDWMIGDYKSEWLDAEILKGYIQRRLDDCIDKLGFEKEFNVSQEIKNKTQWMEQEVYASALTDFFHKKPIDYAKNNKTYNTEDLF